LLIERAVNRAINQRRPGDQLDVKTVRNRECLIGEFELRSASIQSDGESCHESEEDEGSFQKEPSNDVSSKPQRSKLFKHAA